MCKPEYNPIFLCTVESLIKIGLKGLRGPAYLGDNFVAPLDMDIYDSISVDELTKYREKMSDVVSAIANKNNETGKNVGRCRARELGLNWLNRKNRNGEIWYQGLGLAENKKEHEDVVMSISEWADGESIIRHIGYGNDYFCTSDNGKSARGASIFDEDHKQWLASEFGVNFVTPEELGNLIQSI
jgi:hypothetical protein